MDGFAGGEEAESGEADADFGDDSVDDVLVRVERGEEGLEVGAVEAVEDLLPEDDLAGEGGGGLLLA